MHTSHVGRQVRECARRHDDALGKQAGPPARIRRGLQLFAADDLVEEALVVDVLIKVLTPLLGKHRLAPTLNHGERPLCVAKVDDAGVELQVSVATDLPLGVALRVELVRGHEHVGRAE